MKRLFQKLQCLRQNQVRGGITRLEVPTDPMADPENLAHQMESDRRSHRGVLSTTTKEESKTFWTSTREHRSQSRL
jgi:hypothetical protein